MKKLLMTITTGVLLMSCGSEATTATDVTTATDTLNTEVEEVVVSSFPVNTTESVLSWKGSALAKSHNGTVTLQNGNIEISEGSIVGGELTFDMASIICLDLEGEYKGKLEGHLKAGDFFNVDTFATSKIVIKSVSDNDVTADLTIKDVTKSITFPATIEVTDVAVNVTAKVIINRTDFGVVYGSGNFFELAKDKTISDDIEFDIVVKATK